MTALMSEAATHWTRLDIYKPRQPLLDEMHQAYREALDTEDPMLRAYWVGVGTGYAAGFGFITREALENARRQPGAVTLAEFNLWRKPTYADEETAWACGVLYGYWMGTSERPDAYQCEHCGGRLVEDMDDSDDCDHGRFCPHGCMQDWHANLSIAPRSPYDACSYETGLFE